MTPEELIAKIGLWLIAGGIFFLTLLAIAAKY